MKTKYLLIALLVIVTGCTTEQPTTTSADNGLLEVGAANKLLTAANVDFSQPYNFAYSQTPVENYDTYQTLKPITVTVDEDTTLSIYGSDEPVDSASSEPYVTIDIKAGESYTFESSFKYYQIVSVEPTTAVITVI